MRGQNVMFEEGNQTKFEVGDRVITLNGDRRGVITRIGRMGDCAHVKWDNSQQEMAEFSALKKEQSAVR